MTDDQAAGRRRADAERPAPARRAGARRSPTRSTRSRSAAPRGRPSSPASTPTTTASAGNFYPYGWYGMKDRGNILPAWLQKAGYTTALIGKWLNGYGARDAHGEVPTGLRHLARPARRLGLRLLQLRDEPERQAARPGATPTSRASSSSSPRSRSPRDNPAARRTCWPSSAEVFGPGARTPTGARENPKDYSPDVTGKITEGLVARAGASRRSRSSSGGRRPRRTARTSRRR